MAIPSELLKQKFEQALPYADFVELAGPEGNRGPWDDRYGKLELTDLDKY